MFWRFGAYANQSTLDNILERRDATVEELLDENDLLQELKHQNAKLIDFLREEKVLHSLFNYVIADKPRKETEARSTPDPESKAPEKRVSRREKAASKISFFNRSRSRSSHSNHKHGGDEESDVDEEKKETQRKKFAFVAAEILSSDVWSIIEATLEYPDLLRNFWEFLRSPAPLDPIQAGYFTKINDTLLDRKTEEMLNLIKSLDGIIPEMLKHIECPMIMDLLLKMISLERQEEGQGVVDWLESQGLIPILLSYLSAENPVSTQTSAGDFLKAIITISANATGQDQTVIGPNELTRQLVSEKCITQIIKDMLSGGNPLTVGVGIVIEVIRKNNSDYDAENNMSSEPRATDPIYLGTLLREFAKNIPAFMSLIRDSSANKPELSVASGGKIQPLGFDRFKTCELMAELLHCSNMGLLNERSSDEAMRARDEQRQKLKQQGKLIPAPVLDTESEERFTGSVDSHGFHHAEVPSDTLQTSLEVQNANDEDGFEKVAIPEPEVSPDQTGFDGENPQEGQVNQRRVSLLTQQIQEQIDETEELVTSPEIVANEADDDMDVNHPEYKPAPLSLHILGEHHDNLDQDALAQSSATLHAENADIDGHSYEVDVDGSPVIGDVLKIQFVDHQVVPTILDFFFRFPWNNFLHNVVYDVVQQVFNGSLERGHNRILAQDLFNESSCDLLFSKKDVVQRILDGQSASDISQAKKGMRLGYMGHLTLIAEEICKFAERYPADILGDGVYGKVTAPEWIDYVQGILSETRERDNAVLGGVRPEQGNSARTLSSAGLMSQVAFIGNGSGLADAGLAVPSDSLELLDAGNNNNNNTHNNNNAELPLRDGPEYDQGEAQVENDDVAMEEDQLESSDNNDTTTQTTDDSSDQNHTIPAPLSIPPSRARLQLAARLAQRKKEAEEAANSSSDLLSPHQQHEGELTSSPISVNDPDLDDSTANLIVASMERDEPLTNDTMCTETSLSTSPFKLMNMAHRGSLAGTEDSFDDEFHTPTAESSGMHHFHDQDDDLPMMELDHEDKRLHNNTHDKDTGLDEGVEKGNIPSEK